ncbi:MAG TPA: ABC transporter permease [Thermoplasmata archaeon]|jgi:ABC-2 type transport system permease protein|nr:MAG TPA: ABC transporter permease [Thermoplasmata archaeon]
MSGLGNITRKEIRELLTPATFVPIILVALIFATMGSSIQGIQEKSLAPPTIGVITEDNSTLGGIASTILYTHARSVYNSTSESDLQGALETVKQQNGVAVIVIPKNFTERITQEKPGTLQIYWIMKGAGLMDTISSSAVESLISYINTNISKALIRENTTVNASFVLAPTQRAETTYFKSREFVGLSPSTISGMLSSQSLLIPIVMMMIIIMAGSIVITSMALEKENKTLETLLTLPVKRTSIVTGKIIAAAVIGLILAVIYMIGMQFYFSGFQISSGVNLASFGLTLTSTDFIWIGVSLFIALIAGLSLCMLLGTFAKSYKSAQTLTFPITMLAMIPMFITMFADFDTLPLALKVFTFAIPFSHPMMAPRALLFHDYTLVVGGIVYVAVFAIVTISIVVWVFKTDRLLTGTMKFKWLKKMKIRRF